MNKKEAKKVIKILITADGGCQYCVSDLLKLFSKEFPEFKELAEDIFKKKFNKNINNKNDCHHKKERYHLYGWDDEGVYFWDDEMKREWCLNNYKDLYNELLELCIKYFKEEKGVK